MKIAITGIRGIPANYGGFETFTEELATRLVQRGHDVTVYGRKNNIKTKEKIYKGVRLTILPTINHKYLDTVFHTFIAVLHLLFRKFDVVLICNAANSLFSFLPRLTGKKVLVNVDGIERKRKKWNRLGKLYYLLSEWLSTFLPNGIVTDAKAIQDYYWKRFKKSAAMIAYGASVGRTRDPEGIRKYGLQTNKYILYVSRLEPENNAHLVIEAFEQVKTDFALVIVGDAPYADDYKRKLHATRDKRVKFLGAIYGPGYRILQQNAYCYIQATEVGGTHPALVEAMGFGNCVICLDTPENREVVGNAGLFFGSVEDLRRNLQLVLDKPTLLDGYRQQAMQRIKANYDWDTISTRYEELFLSVLNGKLSSTSMSLSEFSKSILVPRI